MTAYNIVVDSATHQQGKLVFLHSAGGGGKTFLCNTIAAAVHAQGQNVLTCASSSISAILLVGGHTSHSTFKIPIPSYDDTTCNIRRGTHLAELLCQTSLIIWDEVLMQNQHDIETVDRTLHDICNIDAPFGEKLLVLVVCVFTLSHYRSSFLTIYFRRLLSDIASCFTRITGADCCSFILPFTFMASY